MRTECEENPVLQRDLEEIAQSSVPFEKLAGKSHLQPNSSIKDKIFKAFRNYFNK